MVATKGREYVCSSPHLGWNAAWLFLSSSPLPPFSLPPPLRLACMLGTLSSSTKVDFVERGAVPGLVVVAPGGGSIDLNTDVPFQHFEPNPLDNEQHFPSGELGMLGAPLTVSGGRPGWQAGR